jgi:hypothetical protein
MPNKASGQKQGENRSTVVDTGISLLDHGSKFIRRRSQYWDVLILVSVSVLTSV